MVEGKEEEIKKKIKELKERLPAHSIPPSMIQELERLEESLKDLQEDKKDS
jgi:hypothetical protein